jgi:DNA-binding NtrC family response regulator
MRHDGRTRGKQLDWGVALLIGDKARHAEDVRCALEARFSRVLLANSVEQCMEIIETEALAFVLVDIDSLIGSVYIAAIAAKKSPSPIVFAVYEEHQPTVEQTFLLGQCGVRELLRGPLQIDRFRAKLAQAFEAPPKSAEISTFVANYLGHRPLLEFMAEVRQEFLDQAIDRAQGNKAKAARIAGVKRVIVQRAAAERPWRRPPPARSSDGDVIRPAALSSRADRVPMPSAARSRQPRLG